MPLIAPASRRHPRVRALFAALYLLLTAGAFTMIYPFLLLLAGTSKSQVDEHEFRVVPTFLHDDTALYRKQIEALCNENLAACRVAYDREIASFGALEPPPPAPPALLEAWRDFLGSTALPATAWTIGHWKSPVSKTIPARQREFKRQLSRAHGGRLDEVNRALGTEFPHWSAFDVEAENFLSRRDPWLATPMQLAAREFKRTVPVEERVAFRLEAYFRQEYLKPLHGRDIAAYNRVHGTAYPRFEDIPLPDRAPSAPAARAEWEEFTRSLLNPLWIQPAPAARAAYADFLLARYGSLAALNRAHGTAYPEAEAITPPPPETAGLAASDWETFLAGWTDPDTGRVHRADLDHLRLVGVESLFRDFLRGRFASLAAFNQATGLAVADWESVHPPQAELHAEGLARARADVRREFCLRGFLHVFDYLFLHGRALVNTAWYCALSVGLALLVNPLAAYALSRFRLRNRYGILFFLLLTMAFPPMVSQIPVFLQLRDLGLLNSFAALLLPHLAHGYSIFLLKGFFDSLPREVYESAELDGAGEWTLFWHLTLAMSKPILAVVALTAFTTAYGNFMFALLLCQDTRMWTLMVWIFKLQQESGDAVVYASLLVAAVPTFVLFVICQRIILRGMVVPMEK
jgi:multiple sugar transport system permease protein